MGSLKKVMLLLMVSFAVQADHGHENDVERIEALYAGWREAVRTADIPGYVSVLHPDVRLIPPGADVIEGAAGYAKFLEPVFKDADYVIEVTAPQVITVVDDIAVAEYEYVIHLTLKNPDRGISEPGALTASRSEARYFDVLRKKADGKWSIWRHTWQAM